MHTAVTHNNIFEPTRQFHSNQHPRQKLDNHGEPTFKTKRVLCKATRLMTRLERGFVRLVMLGKQLGAPGFHRSIWGFPDVFIEKYGLW